MHERGQQGSTFGADLEEHTLVVEKISGVLFEEFANRLKQRVRAFEPARGGAANDVASAADVAQLIDECLWGGRKQRAHLAGMYTAACVVGSAASGANDGEAVTAAPLATYWQAPSGSGSPGKR